MASSSLDSVRSLMQQMNRSVLGQESVVHSLSLALLCNGNVLLEGLPGTAKTRSIKTLARVLNVNLGRIQFTPDLLPADVTGSETYHDHDGANGTLQFEPGPIFNELILADEINRAPAKVQSALLEAMEERQVTVAGKTYKLPPLFLVLATQNPIEQEGTYPLPEAQLDRFLLHVQVGYPDSEAEMRILHLTRNEAQPQEASLPQPISEASLFTARQQILNMYMSEPVERYIVELILGTRQPERYSEELAQWIEYGGSPRATIALDRCARAHAWLRGADFVSPDDVQNVLADVLRHRLILSFEAEANGISPDAVIAELMRCIPVA